MENIENINFYIHSTSYIGKNIIQFRYDISKNGKYEF